MAIKPTPASCEDANRSSRHEVPWDQAEYLHSLDGPPVLRAFSWSGRRSPLSIDDVRLPVVRYQVTSGEPVTFGRVRLAQGALEHTGKQIALTQLSAVRHEVVNSVMQYVFEGSGTRIEVLPVHLGNPDILIQLLRETTNASMPGR